MGHDMSDAELVDAWNLVVAVVHGTQQDLMTDLTDRTGIPSAWFEVLVRCVTPRTTGYR